MNGQDVTYMNNYFQGKGPNVKCCFWNCVDTVNTYYIYSGGEVIAEFNDNGSLAYNYVYGLGQRLARFTNAGTKQVYHNDHLGSMRALTSSAGSVVSKVDYYPFGEELGVTGSPGRFTFTGKELEEQYDFDLYYYGARFMDAITGRFISPDPVKDFINPYSYVHNNPVNAIDPTGMVVEWKSTIVYYRQALALQFAFPPPMQDEIEQAQNPNWATKYEKAREAIETAIVAAHGMAAIEGENSTYWNAIADALQGFLDNGNWSIQDAMPDDRGAVHETTKEGNSMLYINSTYLDDAHHDYLVGFILHEGAHAVFESKNGEFYRTLDRISGYQNSEMLSNVKLAYSEDFAWRGTVRYFHLNPPKATIDTNSKLVSTFNKIEGYYSGTDMSWAMSWIADNLLKGDVRKYWKRLIGG